MLSDRTSYFGTSAVAVSIPAIDKARLASEFGNAAAYYNQHAVTQRQCAAELVSHLREADPPLPPGKILELGCGTGFVTRELVKSFPDHDLEITDLSNEMVAYCQEQIIPLRHSSIRFRQLDAESLFAGNRYEDQYRAIASGFVVQWFEDVYRGLAQLSQALVSGGLLVASFPTNQSFPEWKAICEQNSLPFTGNPMPDIDSLCYQLQSDGLKCNYQERWISMHFDQAIDFFKGLKRIGAGLGRSPVSLTPHQFRQLINAWDAQYPAEIQVSYHIAFLTLQRQ